MLLLFCPSGFIVWSENRKKWTQIMFINVACGLVSFFKIQKAYTIRADSSCESYPICLCMEESLFLKSLLCLEITEDWRKDINGCQVPECKTMSSSRLFSLPNWNSEVEHIVRKSGFENNGLGPCILWITSILLIGLYSIFSTNKLGWSVSFLDHPSLCDALKDYPLHRVLNTVTSCDLEN